MKILWQVERCWVMLGNVEYQSFIIHPAITDLTITIQIYHTVLIGIKTKLIQISIDSSLLNPRQLWWWFLEYLQFRQRNFFKFKFLGPALKPKIPKEVLNMSCKLYSKQTFFRYRATSKYQSNFVVFTYFSIRKL